MATKSNPATKLILKVYKDKANAPEATLQRTFSHINPELSDDALYSIGLKLAALQTRELAGVTRTDSATIAE